MSKFKEGDYVRLVRGVAERFPPMIGDYEIARVTAVQGERIYVLPALRRFKEWSQYDLALSTEAEFKREMYERRKNLRNSKKNRLRTAG